MSRISVDVSSARIPVLQVGYQGENEVTDVLFDISSWITEFGEGVAQLRVKRPGNSEDESYVLSLIITDGIAVWTVSDTDTFNKGNGKVQLSYLVGNIVKKAVIYPYKVGKSIVGADNPVDPFDSWIERSKAWATGKTLDGDAVPETDETYQNNAKYYAEQADILGSAQVVLATEQATLATAKATLATEKADAAAASETNAAASEAAVNGVSTQLTTRMSAIETEQSVQSARMDTFTSLPEGSTSGNAELADIRVGSDGTTYDTAGNAVRGQISGLKSDLDHIVPDLAWKFNILDKITTHDGDYISPNNGNVSTNANFSYFDYIIVKSDTTYTLSIINSFYGAWYDENKNYISGITLNNTGELVTEVTAPQNAKYLRGSGQTVNIDSFTMKQIGEVVLNEDIKISKGQIVGAVKTTVLTVNPSGEGDFTTIKGAFDSIVNPSKLNRFVVEFYGNGSEYDLTQEVPFESGAIGLKVPSFTKLKGMGGKEKNILVARLSTLDGTYSTINLNASSELEDLTIIGFNTRYTIHDDFYNQNDLNCERHIKNCHFISEKTYYRRSYGAGIRSGCKWYFEDCIFDGATSNNDGSYSCHNNTNFTMPTLQYFENCRFNAVYSNTDNDGNDITSAVRFGSITTNANGIKNHVKFVGCKIQNLFLNEEKPTQTGTGILFDVTGYGNDNFTSHILNTDGVDYSSNIDVI